MRREEKRLLLVVELITILSVIFVAYLFVKLSYVLPFPPFLQKGVLYRCSAKELIPVLEDAFELKFPDDITDVKAAKTVRWMKYIQFIMRFAAEPNDVDTFIKSFPGKIHFVELDPNNDYRQKTYGVPSWYKQPIRKGKRGVAFLVKRINRIAICIDMTDENKYIVYLRGYY